MYTEESALAAMAVVRSQVGPSHANAAWALYELSHSAEAGLYLSQADVCTLCGVANWSSARRILSRLAKLGLLHFFTGRAGAPVHIVFCDLAAFVSAIAQPPPLSGSSQSITLRSDTPTSNSRAQRAMPALSALTPADASAVNHSGANCAECGIIGPKQRRRLGILLERRRAQMDQTGAQRADAASPNNSSELVSLFIQYLSSWDPEQTTELPVAICPDGEAAVPGQPNEPLPQIEAGASIAAVVQAAEVAQADTSIEPPPAGPASSPAAPSADAPPADGSCASAPCAPPPYDISSANPHAPVSQEERDRSYALLLDPEVGIDVQTARRFAAEHRFEYLLRQVCTWRRDLNTGKVTGPGALIHRVKHGFGCTTINADRTTALYRRHMPAAPVADDEDSEAARRRKYLPDEYADIIIG